jgi:hypothetical protein
MARRKTDPVTFKTVRDIGLLLPDVEESTSYGTPALKMRGKLFARLHQDGYHLVLKCEFLEREMLLHAAPDVFSVTAHYKNYPWILVDLSTVSRDALPDMIERAWCMVANKKQLAQHGSSSEG